VSRAAAFAAGLLCGACGWHAGLETPPGAETIGVAFFNVEWDVLQRDLAPELQQALTTAVTDLVGLRLIEPDRSDLVITGRLIDYSRRGGVRSAQHEMLETAVKVTVEAELRRRSSGVVVAQARGMVPVGYATADRVLDAGTGDVTFIVGGKAAEASARARAMRILAEGLVLDLFAQSTATEPRIDPEAGPPAGP
jgi:hypothetical protein